MLKPFMIDIPDAVLQDLRERLDRTRLPETSETGWRGGIDLRYLRELIDYWRDGFDWRAQENALNRLSHLRGVINGTTVHTIHERGKGPAPMPLALVHGWPDSPYRFTKLIPLLTDPGAHGGDPADAFDVVVPSLPGYGFSMYEGEYGNAARFGGMVHAVMNALGYERYGAHGGDVGTMVCERLSVEHHDAVIGIHMLDVPPGHLSEPVEDVTAAEAEFFQAMGRYAQEAGGYAHIQATRPWTAATALTDSPAGLAAWIVEKFQGWSDCGGDVERRFTKDELLTNVMIYWVTATIGSSFLTYRDYMGAPPGIGPKPVPSAHVPAGFAIFEKDIGVPPRSWAERFFNVQRWTHIPAGGHFAALEEPERLAEDIRAFFRPLRGGPATA